MSLSDTCLKVVQVAKGLIGLGSSETWVGICEKEEKKKWQVVGREGS